MTAGRVVVAASQYPLDPVRDHAAWFDKLTRWIEDGAATGADLLVFPEYGAMEAASAAGPETAGDLGSSLAAVSASLPALDAHLSAEARRTGVHVLGPSGPCRVGHHWVNRATLHAPNGASGAVDKTILTPFERAWGLSGGHGPLVFDTALGRIGVAICYDCEFPLLARAMAEAGADLLLIPSCTEHASGAHRVRIGAASRALENQVASVVSHTVGAAAWSAAVDHNTGAAGIYVPPDVSSTATGVVAAGQWDEPGWIVGAIEVAELRRIRRSGEVRNHIDWERQPGALVLPPPRIVDLR